MTQEDYSKEIKKHWLACENWSIFLLLIITLIGFTIFKYANILNTVWYSYCATLVLCAYMILSNAQDVKYKSLALVRLIEKEKFKEKLRIANNKFYKVFDNMCCDNNSLKEKLICRDLFVPIVPSSNVKKWERDPYNASRIIGYWPEDGSIYEITCPNQLRDILIKLQNSL